MFINIICFRYCNNFIAPTEIEDILQTHPAVLECLVFGMKDPIVQERVSAVVVLKKDYSCSIKADEIIQFVNSKVNADFKKITGTVLFRDIMPRNTSGKLLRREVREWAENKGRNNVVINIAT